MASKLTPTTKFAIQGVSVLVVLSLLIVTLILVLRTPPLLNGGSPNGLCPVKAGLAESVAAENNSSPFGAYRFAAVAADGQPCSTVGVKILAEKGGSAVDAAIATMACVGAVNCHTSGIGGGHFMTIYDTPRGGSKKELATIIARERAPAAATEDMFIDNPNPDASTFGGLAIAVPGEIKGFYEAWLRYGRVPWADLFTDTIYLCRNGIVVNGAVAGAIYQYQDIIRADPNLSELLLDSDGSILTEGDIMYNPKLANTLEAIAADPGAYYNPSSTLAQDIIADLQEYGAIITLEDLASYAVYLKDPLNVTLQTGNLIAYAPTAPSSGVVLQFILNILDGYNFTADDVNTTDEEILTNHRITEAFKFAYAKRSALGDEEYWNVEELLRNMTSDDYAESIRLRINDERTYDVEYYEPEFDYVTDHGTSHTSVYAPDGGAVAVTSTLNTFFGSKVRGSRTGIIFNNEMDDFSTPNTTNFFGVPASESNFIVPGKMPMSSMSPVVLLDSNGVVRFIGGAAGGTTITTITAYVTMRTLWFGDRVDTATDEARLHHQLVPNELQIEDFIDQEIASGLRQKGHNVTLVSSMASVQSIHNTCIYGNPNPDNCIYATSDRRKEGVPDGF